MKISANKIGSILKNVKLNKRLLISKKIECTLGSLVAVKVLKVNQKYNKLELNENTFVKYHIIENAYKKKIIKKNYL